MAEGDFGWGLALGFIIGVPIGIIVFLALTRNTQSIPMIRPTTNYVAENIAKTYTNTDVAKNRTKTYTNTEEWEFLKDPETGRVSGVRINRKAEEN